MEVLRLLGEAEFTDPISVIFSFCSSATLNAFARVSKWWCARAVPLMEARLTRGLRWRIPQTPGEIELKWIGTYTAGGSYGDTIVYLLSSAGEIFDVNRCRRPKLLSDPLRLAGRPSAEYDTTTPFDAVRVRWQNDESIVPWRINDSAWRIPHHLSKLSRQTGPLEYFCEFALEQPTTDRFLALAAGTYQGTALGNKHFRLLIDDYASVSDELRRIAFIAKRADVAAIPNHDKQFVVTLAEGNSVSILGTFYARSDADACARLAAGKQGVVQIHEADFPVRPV